MIVLVGPTASGKSELAVSLALKAGGEIVSADSRQVYRGLDAATAKPSAALRARVPHHLLDVAEPSEAYDAARFAREASAALADIRARGKVPIVCGGTGLYIRALLEGLSPLPKGDPAVRARLAKLAETAGLEALHERLTELDPGAAKAIPAGNKQRLIRALEVIEMTGKPITEQWAQGRSGGEKPKRILLLTTANDVLRERIERRTRNMWPELLAEVRRLVPDRWNGDEPGFTSLGYREALSVIRGNISDEEGLNEMIKATNAYAKRQRTWFRNQLKDAVPIDAGGTPQRTLELALAAI